MSLSNWILLIYSSISLLTLFNKGIRNLYISVIDSIFWRFHKLRKKYYKTKTKGCITLIFGLLADILELSIYFISAPLIIIYHFPNRYKYRFTLTPFWKIEPPKPIKKKYLTPPLIIKTRKDIPFVPNTQQVIYFENSFNEKLNQYISANHETIVSNFKKRGYDFIYLPKAIDKLSLDEAQYMNPALKEGFTAINNKTAYYEIKNKLLSFIEASVSSSLIGGFLRYRESVDDSYLFTYFTFTNLDEAEIKEQIRAYLSVVGAGGPKYRIAHSKEPDAKSADFADENFDTHTQILIAEIKERIEALRQKGINEMLLKSIFSFESVELSRLVITSEYKIFLPDYNNLEITMHPLPKAVFILFLNHPEGILFKNLVDHRNELIQIYKSISGRENIKAMERSIDNVVNSSLNSINEKCSRIKEAFVMHFDDSIAQNYYITGGRATPKKIILNRKLVTIE